jgi:3-dehydrosphinganine reductase
LVWAENETKPLITKLLSGSNAVEAVDVAKRAINGIKAGKFSIPCNFDGWMLSVETVGMSPQSSAFGALVEILLIGFLRFVSICFTWNWYRIISSQYDNEKK